MNMKQLLMSNQIDIRDRYKVGRGRSIHDNVTGGDMWFINDERRSEISGV